MLPRSRDHVHLPAGRAAGLGGRVAGLDFELGQRIDRTGKSVGHRVVVHELDAVEKVAIGRVAGAIGGHRGGTESRIVLPDGAAAAAHGDGAGSAGLDAGDKLRQLDEVAAVQAADATILSPSITVPSVALSVCRLAAEPSTVTVSVTSPILSWIFSRATC